ncbi:unnamed protein product [Zymoseptoria tritici ST99CH_1E4]|uniref:Phosphatidylethanolamine-binding protein n=1 Tax=Zymoseptoria tritici ST99CH_1E4 TaxID=1276532 RepID=A0A2H1H0S2_ZYMTR|nr:unnamed protein product [Zymoseptoria tritici ST99CH_1E4]
MTRSALIAAAIAGAWTITPTLAVPPEDFGFPSAPNDTILDVSFRQTLSGYEDVVPGSRYGIAIAENEPNLSLNTTAYPRLDSYQGEYIVIMVDPDASYPENPSNRFILHWLRQNLTSAENANPPPAGLQIVTDTAKLLNSFTPAIVQYRRPSPPTNSSAHRYILYAFEQPQHFRLPEQWSGLSGSNRTGFNLTSFISDTNLGTPCAANYFYTSNQTVVPDDFISTNGSSYPGGDGTAITSGDPYGPGSSAPNNTHSANSTMPTRMPNATTSGGAGPSPTSSPTTSAEPSSTSASTGGAAMLTGAGSLVAAGLVGLTALL